MEDKRKCTACKSLLSEEHFGGPKRTGPYKTCLKCRERDQKNRVKYCCPHKKEKRRCDDCQGKTIHFDRYFDRCFTLEKGQKVLNTRVKETYDEYCEMEQVDPGEKLQRNALLSNMERKGLIRKRGPDAFHGVKEKQQT